MDPFRDDHSALQIRVEELEVELEEARVELVRVSAPAKLRANEAADRKEAEEIEIRKLEQELAALKKESEASELRTIRKQPGVNWFMTFLLAAATLALYAMGDR